MFSHQLGLLEFLALVAVAAGAFGRALKRMWPAMPGAALPWLVLGAAYVLVVCDALAGGASLRASLFAGLAGCLAGGSAIGGHELAKKALGSVVGEAGAERLLGKLDGAAPVAPDIRAGGALLLLLTACNLTPAQQAKVDACAAGYADCLTDAKLVLGTDDEKMRAYELCRDKVHVACLGPAASASASASAVAP